MAHARRSALLRLPVFGCLLGGSLVVHLAVRYLHVTLFGFVKYRGGPPIVPWIVLGVYLVGVVGAAGLAATRLEWDGVVIGTGLLLLVVEPFTIPNGGCEVSSTASLATAPQVATDGAALIVWTWNGSCSMFLNAPLLGLATVLLAGGLWRGSVPDVVLARWRTLLTTANPASGN